jgi:nicotinamidase/pyrazinamidase
MADEALLVVDVQNDFCAGGSLGVPASPQIIGSLNDYIRRFADRGARVIASRDWHPPVTRHFADHGVVWPVHCVQGTPGAEFHPDLRLPPEAVIVSKGSDPEEDSYSAFEARLPDGRPLGDYLRDEGITRIYVGGLATDYCVRSSVLDALKAGFQATVLLDGSRGVDVQPGDSEKALAEMVSAGADVATLERLRGSAE